MQALIFQNTKKIKNRRKLNSSKNEKPYISDVMTCTAPMFSEDNF